jgi:hypothetical protein
MSVPAFLVAEQTVEKNGEGPGVELGASPNGLIELTLGILDIIEQESLDVEIHASTDGTTWTPKPIAAFPQKFYKGTSKILLDCAKHPDARFIRAQWKVNRWGHWKTAPMFRFFVFAEPAS